MLESSSNCRALVVSRRGAAAAVRVSSSMRRRPVQVKLVVPKFIKIWALDGTIYRFAVGGDTEAIQETIVKRLAADYQAGAFMVKAAGYQASVALAGVQNLGAEWLELSAADLVAS